MNLNEWSVYIVTCKNGKLYTGITTDLNRRFLQHKSGKGSKMVHSSGGPVKIDLIKTDLTKSDASKLECKIKKYSRIEKLKLLSGESNE